MANTIFPHPQVFRKLYSLVKEDFTKYFQSDYSETPQRTGTGLEKEAVKLLEDYSTRYDYRVHLTDRDLERGFAGLLHKFDAGIEDRSDLSQCLFEVKYRGSEGKLTHENIMKFHHATFEYFLKLLTEQRWDKVNVFRCFVTSQEASDEYRQFFYTWGIALIDPILRPLPSLPSIFEQAQKEYGATDQLLDLIERSYRLNEQAYFSLASLMLPEQEYSYTLDLNRLNPAVDSASILVEHKHLHAEVEALQQRYRRGRFQ